MEIFGYFGKLLWWQYVIIVLFLTHLTILSVTLFLHRSMAHRSVIFLPIVSHFFRFWLWLTTGMITKEWVAVHRRHHAKCETADDPHSPVILGLSKILFLGALVYNLSAKDSKTLEYVEGNKSIGLPDDWLEKYLYQKYKWLGISLFLLLEIYLFGVIGLVVWLVQMMWIPFWAAGVINGVGHYFGYRNADTPDRSTNILPVGIFIGGEELHNNHHLYPTSAKFSQRKFEFDWGWQIIRFLQWIGLAKVKKATSLPIQKYVLDREHLGDEDFYLLVSRHRYYLAKKFRDMFGDKFFTYETNEILLRFYRFFYVLSSKEQEVKEFNALISDSLEQEGVGKEFTTFLLSFREQNKNNRVFAK